MTAIEFIVVLGYFFMMLAICGALGAGGYWFVRKSGVDKVYFAVERYFWGE